MCLVLITFHIGKSEVNTKNNKHVFFKNKVYILISTLVSKFYGPVGSVSIFATKFSVHYFDTYVTDNETANPLAHHRRMLP